MQVELEKHSSTNESHMQGEEKKKYAKLTGQIKELFIEKIVFQNLSIKQASQLLNINYSSAKAIASTHKKIKAAKMRKCTSKRATKACEYRSIDENQEATAVRLVSSSIGGLVTSEIVLPKRKLISKITSSVCQVSVRKDVVQVTQEC